VKSLLGTGAVDLEDSSVIAHARMAGGPVDVAVLASALRRASFSLCGSVANGAITWICPAQYVEQVALPALRSAATAAGREPPPLIMHVPVALSTDVDAVRAAMRERYAFYVRVPNYSTMFAQAGFPEAKDGRWTDAMIDAVAVYGTETAVAERLRGLLATGVDELLVSAVGVGPDAPASAQRVLRLIGELSLRS